MKKIRATRLMAMVMAVCMVLALAVPVSALTTNHLKLTIAEREDPQRQFSVTSTSISPNTSSLAETLANTVGALMDGEHEANWKAQNGREYGLYKFESVNMRTTIYYGLDAFKKSFVDQTDATAWINWVNQYDEVGENTVGLKDMLKSLEAKVGDLTLNTPYVLVYEPQLPASYDGVDDAYGNEYTFTIEWITKTTGGGGGGGSTPTTPPEPAKYDIIVPDSANATVIASAMQAAAGDKVSITIKFAEGYVLDTLTVKGDSGAVLATSDFGNNTYVFTMPAEAVTVSVTAKKASGADHFVDVDPDGWYEDAIDYVVDNDLMSGVGDNKFEPDGPLTRAMVAQIFYNLEGKPTGNHSEPFPDVEAGKWYYDAISWGYVNKVVAGYGDGLYRPDQNVTREELVQIFFNYAKAKGWYNGEQADLTGFSDYENVAPWHKEAVSWGVSAKLLSGKGGNKIDPKVDSLRCEAAQMLMNLNLNIRK